MSNTNENNASGGEDNVSFKKFEPLLQKSYNDKQLKVLKYTATKLLPPGENYCSIIIKFDVKIRRGKSSAIERLHLVAKTITKEGDNHLVKWSQVFPKELFMYVELLPAYQELERNVGIFESDLINIFPKYIGHRYSLEDYDKGNIIDGDSLILMENIKTQGFDTCNRRIGLDVDSAKLALSALARYHALGVALKQKRPDLFKKAVSYAQTLGFDLASSEFGAIFQSALKTIRSMNEFKKHLSVIELSFTNMLEGKTYTYIPEEPWATITHGDFWVNNILFHKDKHGKVDAVKFVDFQLYLYNSPLKDLPYFLCGSLNYDALTIHLDEILNAYYDFFVNTLKRLGCSTTPFSRSAFDVELKRQAVREFPLVASAAKFFLYEVEDSNNDANMINQVLDSDCSDAYKKKLIDIISIYEKRGWMQY